MRRRARPFIPAIKVGAGEEVTRPSIQGRKDRRCAVCRTILSRYNTEDTCYIHTPKDYRNLVLDEKKPRWANHGSTCMQRLGCECDECLAGTRTMAG